MINKINQQQQEAVDDQERIMVAIENDRHHLSNGFWYGWYAENKPRNGNHSKHAHFEQLGLALTDTPVSTPLCSTSVYFLPAYVGNTEAVSE